MRKTKHSWIPRHTPVNIHTVKRNVFFLVLSLNQHVSLLSFRVGKTYTKVLISNQNLLCSLFEMTDETNPLIYSSPVMKPCYDSSFDFFRHTKSCCFYLFFTFITPTRLLNHRLINQTVCTGNKISRFMPDDALVLGREAARNSALWNAVVFQENSFTTNKDNLISTTSAV